MKVRSGSVPKVASHGEKETKTNIHLWVVDTPVLEFGRSLNWMLKNMILLKLFFQFELYAEIDNQILPFLLPS